MERLSGLDSAFLSLESSTMHLHVAIAAVIDPSTMAQPSTFDDLKAFISRRLMRDPAFRRRVVEVPFRLNHPRWVEDPNLDLDYGAKEDHNAIGAKFIQNWNVPGPDFPLHLDGAELVATYPVGPIMEGAGLNVTVLSYVDFGFLAGAELVPDVRDMADVVTAAMDDLLAAADEIDPPAAAPEPVAADATASNGSTAEADPTGRGSSVAGAPSDGAPTAPARGPRTTAPGKAARPAGKRSARKPAKKSEKKSAEGPGRKAAGSTSKTTRSTAAGKTGATSPNGAGAGLSAPRTTRKADRAGSRKTAGRSTQRPPDDAPALDMERLTRSCGPRPTLASRSARRR